VKRVALFVALAAALVALVVAVGAWERKRRADEESRGIAAVLSSVERLDSPDLHGFRIFVNFQCLVYERGRNEFALELCVDHEGRVVEAIDRLGAEPVVWSLRDDPSRSSVRVERATVERLLLRMNVPARYLDPGGWEG
jgi:hypothetical protein